MSCRMNQHLEWPKLNEFLRSGKIHGDHLSVVHSAALLSRATLARDFSLARGLIVGHPHDLLPVPSFAFFVF